MVHLQVSTVAVCSLRIWFTYRSVQWQCMYAKYIVPLQASIKYKKWQCTLTIPFTYTDQYKNTVHLYTGQYSGSVCAKNTVHHHVTLLSRPSEKVGGK